MKRLILTLGAATLIALAAAPVASAAFGIEKFDVTFTNQNGTPAVQSGSHPFAYTTTLEINSKPGPGGLVPDDSVKGLIVDLPAGLAVDPTATPRCQAADFQVLTQTGSTCPNSTAVGIIGAHKPGQVSTDFAAVYNLAPPPGAAAKFGFRVLGVTVTLIGGVRDDEDNNLFATLQGISQAEPFSGSELTLWGNPASPLHNSQRGNCILIKSLGSCPSSATERAFLTLPTSCTGPLLTTYVANSWQEPDVFLSGSVLGHDNAEPPNPLGLSGCGELGFSPTITAKPTTLAAESSSGLDFSLDVHDEGLTSPGARAQSNIRKAVVTLPVGMTANPSSAEGLEVCSEADLGRETIDAAPGEGCPDASKLGTLEVQSPLLEESLPGSLYLAKPYENEFGSLIALYMVIKSPGLGILIKQPVKVEPDPRTGQLVSTADDLPQLPFAHFKLRFREGARSPLVSPPTCGEHEVTAELTPWSGGAPLTTTSTFEIATGNGGGSCPASGTPPFAPGFQAGTIGNEAGSHSPFYMRITRRDGDQDLTKFSAKLPPGMVAKLAGTTQCADAAIAGAKTKTGLAEQTSPSCPASSQIGRVMAGAGVGSVLTYVPGQLYLAGPYNGAPLSVAAIVPALAGPFDVGTVVTRVALRIDPRSALVTVDGAASDPIPHILAGIPLKVRDIRVYADRPDFTLNPTSCEPFSVGAELWGGGADAFSALDDSPLSLAAPFQAANCANLGFKPRLSLKLRGGTKRGGHPALRGTYRPRPGDANLKKLVLRLPRSAFLDQAHIRTICTRVQFAANACPAGAIYGRARAFTPLLEQPLEGPVYLRSSNNNLPDFVAHLRGLIDVEAVARIDSVKGGIRATFTNVPDAPLSKVVVSMRGARKGLIVNSTDLCARKHRANLSASGHNGKAHKAKPVVQAACRKRKRSRSGVR